MSAAFRVSMLSLASVAAPLPANAQEIKDGAEPSAIIVTGERWERTLARTASSVAITDRSELDTRPDMDRLDQILATIPNVTLGSGGLGPSIRGQDTTGVLNALPAFLGGNRPRTTLVVDGRAISYNEFVFGNQPLWDVDRVEVFRSPQTTTQGRNSVAGAIFVNTRAPEFTWGTAARLIAGDYDTREVSAMLTGPIFPEQLALRVAADYRRSRTSSELTSPAVGIDPNRDSYDNLRFKLLGRPSFAPGLEVNLSYWFTGSQAPQLEGIRQPFKERRDPQMLYGTFRSHAEAATLQTRLRATPRTSIEMTLSAGGATVTRHAPAGFGEADNAIHDRSIELIVHRLGNRWKAVGGLSGSRNRLVQAIDLSATPFGLGKFRDRQDSFGVFGELELEALTNVRLTIGSRYQSDRQARTGTLVNGRAVAVLDFDRTFAFVLPKASLAVDLGDALTIGLLAQRAANPGGVTLTPSGTMDLFAAETLWDFEIFARGKLARQNLDFAANLFRYDMRNAQRSVAFGVETGSGTVTFSEIGNVPRAWTQGAEVSLAWQPARAVSVGAGIGLLWTRITRTPLPGDPLLGKEFQRSPRFTGSLSLLWHPTEALELSADLRHRAGYFSDDTETALLRVGPATLLDLRAGWRSGRLRLFGYARNAFDQFYLNSITTGAGLLATAGDPRELGFGVNAQF